MGWFGHGDRKHYSRVENVKRNDPKGIWTAGSRHSKRHVGQSHANAKPHSTLFPSNHSRQKNSGGRRPDNRSSGRGPRNTGGKGWF